MADQPVITFDKSNLLQEAAKDIMKNKGLVKKVAKDYQQVSKLWGSLVPHLDGNFDEEMDALADMAKSGAEKMEAAGLEKDPETAEQQAKEIADEVDAMSLMKVAATLNAAGVATKPIADALGGLKDGIASAKEFVPGSTVTGSTKKPMFQPITPKEKQFQDAMNVISKEGRRS